MKKVIYIPEGLKNLESLFPTIDMNNIEEWYVEALDSNGIVIATTRKYQLGCCCNEDNKVRIHFINSSGELDNINLSLVTEDTDIKSDSWEKSLSHPLDRTKGGSYRHNIKSNEIQVVETKCYTEEDQPWIKELFQTPKAWIETMLPNGFNVATQKSYIPITILDAKFPIRKKDERFEYLVRLSFSMSNSNINLR